jgi:phosphatidylglycerophosphate synthase
VFVAGDMAHGTEFRPSSLATTRSGTLQTVTFCAAAKKAGCETPGKRCARLGVMAHMRRETRYRLVLMSAVALLLVAQHSDSHVLLVWAWFYFPVALVSQIRSLSAKLA